MKLQNVFGTIGVEAADILAKSLTIGKWRNRIQSKRDYHKFFNAFYCNLPKVYYPEQVAAIFYAASITDTKYVERVLGAFSNPKRLTLTDAKIMTNHYGTKAFSGSATNVALVGDGRENSRKLRQKKILVKDVKRNGIWQVNA